MNQPTLGIPVTPAVEGGSASTGGGVKKGPKLDAVSARLQNLRVIGKLYNQRGDNLIRKGGKEREMDFLKYDEAAWFFYRSSLAFRQCGRWRDAGDNLLRCGWSYSRLKQTHMQMVGAAMYCEAGDTFLKVDVSESIEAFKAASKLYADSGNLHLAGVLEKRIAHFHQADKFWEEAATHFLRAGRFMASEVHRDQSDQCFENAAHCYMELGEQLEDAAFIYETLADSCVRTNLRRFQARDYLFKAALCLIGTEMPEIEVDEDKEDDKEELGLAIIDATEEKYNIIVYKVYEFEMIDTLWRVSKEATFLRAILKARMEWDEDTFADHVYWWNQVYPFDKLALKMLRTVRDELREEIERRQEKAARDAKTAEKVERRRKRLEEKANEMAKVGIRIDEEDVADELDKEEVRVVRGEGGGACLLLFGCRPRG